MLKKFIKNIFYDKKIEILQMKNKDLEMAYYTQIQLNKELAEGQIRLITAVQCCCNPITQKQIDNFIVVEHLKKMQSYGI